MLRLRSVHRPLQWEKTALFMKILFFDRWFKTGEREILGYVECIFQLNQIEK